MIFLLLSIAASAAIALVLKLGERWRLDPYAVVAVNYAVAFAGAVALAVAGEARAPAWPEGSGASIAAAVASGGKVAADVGPGWAAAWGVAAGALFFLGLVTYQAAIRAHGVGLAAAMAKLGVLVPMALSLSLWGTPLSGVEGAGIGLALLAIALAHWPRAGDRWRDAVKPALAAVFVCVGLSEFSSKVFQQHGFLVDKPLFVAVTFGVAGLIAGGVVAAGRRRFGRYELLVGAGVGLPNLIGMTTLVSALDALPAPVVYPVLGAGSVIVIQLAGVFCFGERPGRRGWAAVGLTAAALVLVNL